MSRVLSPEQCTVHEQDVRRALRLAREYTQETQTVEEAVADLCRQIDDARASIKKGLI